MIFIKCKNAEIMPSLGKKIDDLYRNSEFPTRTQTEEAFVKMFSDMLGDLQNAIYGIGAAVVVSLLFVAGNAMAIAMRERTSEVAILKAIGFSKGRVLFLVLTEAIVVAGLEAPWARWGARRYATSSTWPSTPRAFCPCSSCPGRLPFWAWWSRSSSASPAASSRRCWRPIPP